MSSDVPRHGFRGEPTPPPAARPRGLTVAVSREAGSRGTTIARAVAEQLGWQLFDQDMLDFLGNDEPARTELLADVPASAQMWVSARLARLPSSIDPTVAAAVRLTLTLAARGDAVLVGRGAGFLLPPETTVHVRIVAPKEQRVGYMAERLRLTQIEAEMEVDSRDRKRAELGAALGAPSTGATGYDMILNAARLGVDICADLIVQAVRAKQLRPAADVFAARPA